MSPIFNLTCGVDGRTEPAREITMGFQSGKTPLSEAQGCRLFVIVQFRPADAPLSPEPRGDQCTGLCVFFYVLCVVFVLLCFFFSSKHLLP